MIITSSSFSSWAQQDFSIKIASSKNRAQTHFILDWKSFVLCSNDLMKPWCVTLTIEIPKGQK